MKNKFLLVAIIAVILSVGMVLVSCGSNCPTEGACANATPATMFTDICWAPVSLGGTPNLELMKTCTGLTEQSEEILKKCGC